jgi:T-lymphoma invasion and metastasis-inducing protein 1
MSSRDETEKSYNVPLPDNNYVTVYLRDSMTNEEFLASACIRKNLNPMEHFVRVKKRRDMEDHNYFVPHRNDLIETYVSDIFGRHSESFELRGVARWETSEMLIN